MNGTGKRGRENRTGVNWSDPEARKEYQREHRREYRKQYKRERYRRDPERVLAEHKAWRERHGLVAKTIRLAQEDAAWVTEYGDGNFNEGVRRLIAEVRTTREEAKA